MLEDGYAAVSSRSVAARVGINAPLVHYYFPTLDDLFIAVLERRAGPNVDRLTDALDSDQPLLTWWKLASNRRGAALFVELMAAANHRPLLKAEVGQVAQRVRKLQVDRLPKLLDIDPTHFDPALQAVCFDGERDRPHQAFAVNGFPQEIKGPFIKGSGRNRGRLGSGHQKHGCARAGVTDPLKDMPAVVLWYD